MTRHYVVPSEQLNVAPHGQCEKVSAVSDTPLDAVRGWCSTTVCPSPHDTAEGKQRSAMRSFSRGAG